MKAERVELQMCSPMYAKSMAKACSLLSSATEDILYHCHSHFNVQVCALCAASLRYTQQCLLPLQNVSVIIIMLLFDIEV